MRFITTTTIGLLCAAITAPTTLAAFQAFAGPLTATRDAYFDALGGPQPIEAFESFGGGAIVGEIPSIGVRFLPEDAAGGPLPLPITAGNSPVTAPIWMINFGNGRPAFSPWVIEAIGEDDAIYAFGQANSQTDFVRIEAFDACGNLIGSVDAPPLSHAFAGFVSTVPVARVVVTPLGNFDGANGMDDLTASLTPPPGSAPCTGDVNGDDVINSTDLNAVLAEFGCTADCCADLDNDGDTDSADLNILLAAFGATCE